MYDAEFTKDFTDRKISIIQKIISKLPSNRLDSLIMVLIIRYQQASYYRTQKEFDFNTETFNCLTEHYSSSRKNLESFMQPPRSYFEHV